MLNEMRVRHDSADVGRMAGAGFAANGPHPFPPPYGHVMLKGLRHLTTPATLWDCRPAIVGGAMAVGGVKKTPIAPEGGGYLSRQASYASHRQQ